MNGFSYTIKIILLPYPYDSEITVAETTERDEAIMLCSKLKDLYPNNSINLYKKVEHLYNP